MPMFPEDADKTSFIIRRGTFRFRRNSFRLCNAGSSIKRVMDLAVQEINFELCLVYLDDILVLNRSVEEHLERLQVLFEWLRAVKLKFKQSKCHILQTSISFLGHVISRGSVATDPEKIKTVKAWPVSDC